MADTSELKTLTVDHQRVHLFLISEQANYLEKNQRSAIEHIVSNAGLNADLLEHLTTFFIGLADQFDQK